MPAEDSPPPESIWFGSPRLESIQSLCAGNMMAGLGITFTDLSHDSLTARMPVVAAVLQPMGLLHGGALSALAESVGSVAGNLCVNPATHYCLGMQIHSSFLRPTRTGTVKATARPLRLGRTVQVWDIAIVNERGRDVAACRLSLSVQTRPPGKPLPS